MLAKIAKVFRRFFPRSAVILTVEPAFDPLTGQYASVDGMDLLCEVLRLGFAVEAIPTDGYAAEWAMRHQQAKEKKAKKRLRKRNKARRRR